METPLIEDLVSAGGPGLIIPAVMFILVLYGARGFFGWHGRRSQNRKEFLDLWTSERISDDLWLEVTVRHLFGTYLPAHVIRTALRHPSSAQALLDLSALWPLLHYDADSRTVRWRSERGNPPIFSSRQKWSYAAMASFMAGVTPPSAMFGRSWL